MILQFRQGDDSGDITRLDFGAVDAGTISAPQSFLAWNARPAQVEGELLGTGDGSKTTFPVAHATLVNHPNAPATVYVDGVQATGVAVDYEHSQFTFSQAPAAGKAVTANYWYGPVSQDTSAAVLTARQLAQWAGDGAKKRFTLPTRCLDVIQAKVGGEIKGTGEYEIQDGGMTFVLPAAPAINVAVQVYYVDPVVQSGYYECRSSGIKNPLNVSGVTDDAETAYFGLGGLLERTNHLVGTGNGSNKNFDTGTPLILRVSQVTVGGAPVTDFSVNAISGVIQFVVAPANNAEVRASYKYERAHRIGNIKLWTARKIAVRVNVPYDAPCASLSAVIRGITQ